MHKPRITRGMGAEGTGSPIPVARITHTTASDTLDRVLADIRQRIADGERSPVLARHMTAVELDELLLALARAEA